MYDAHTFGALRPQPSSSDLPRASPKMMKRLVKGIIFDMDGADNISVQSWHQAAQPRVEDGYCIYLFDIHTPESSALVRSTVRLAGQEPSSMIAGTLTKPVIDFAKMRQRTNIMDGDILEVLGTLPAQERVRVEAIINEVEDEVCPFPIRKLPDYKAATGGKIKDQPLPCHAGPAQDADQ